jgi:uncharacterized protein YerC
LNLIQKRGVKLQDVETWKDIEGYEGLYQVSNLGRIKSFDKTIMVKIKNQNIVTKKGKILKPNNNNNSGYNKVTLSKEGTNKPFTIHRLVAKAFIDNPENKPFVNHKDGNKLNNCVSNLEWVSLKENTQHAFENGLCDEMIKKFSKKVKQYDNNYNFIKEWNSFHEIERETGMSATYICRVCKSPNNKAYGFYWRYSDE